MGTPRTLGGFFLPDSLKVFHAKRRSMPKQPYDIQSVGTVPPEVQNKLLERGPQSLHFELSDACRWRTK